MLISICQMNFSYLKLLCTLFLFSRSYLTNTARLQVCWGFCFSGHVFFPFHYLHNGFLAQSSTHISYTFFKCQQFLIVQSLHKQKTFKVKMTNRDNCFSYLIGHVINIKAHVSVPVMHFGQTMIYEWLKKHKILKDK